MEWEEVKREDDGSDIVTWRAKVPGGWLVSVWAQKTNEDGTGNDVPGGANWGGGLTFLPDDKYLWNPDPAPKATATAPKKKRSP